MSIDRRTPIGELAAFIPGAIGLFETMGLDYSCGGHLPLVDACRAEGLDPEVVMRYLFMLNGRDGLEPWSNRTATEIAQSLVESHRHIREEVKRIELALAAGGPELHDLRIEIGRLVAELIPHMEEEEHHIFHSIAAIESGSPPDEEIRLQLRRLVVAHGVLSNRVRRLRSMRLSIAAEPHAAEVSHELGALAALEAHIHEAMFIENCILYPRALAISEELHAKAS